MVVVVVRVSGPSRLAAMFVAAAPYAVDGRDGREGCDGVVDACLEAPWRHHVARLRGSVPGWWTRKGLVHGCGEEFWHLAMVIIVC